MQRRRGIEALGQHARKESSPQQPDECAGIRSAPPGTEGMAEDSTGDQSDERQAIGPHGGMAESGRGNLHIDGVARLQRLSVVLEAHHAGIVSGEEAASAAAPDAAAALGFRPAQREPPVLGRDDDGATADRLPGGQWSRGHCRGGAAAGTL